jgi:hypothetical protein
MDERIAVNLRRRYVADRSAYLLGDLQKPERAERVRPHRVDRHPIVVDRAGGRSKVCDDIHLDDGRHRDVRMHERVPRLRYEVGDVRAVSRRQVVDADDLMSALQQGPAEVAADEAGAAGDQEPHRGAIAAGRTSR